MRYDERPVIFDCGGETLVGMLARPEAPIEIGVVVIVGGPQYRVGSHRQFVHLSRHLAAGGVACLRFDYRGMGDATGAMRTFEEVSEDIAAAVDALLSSLPAVKRVVLWGLCDGASAACFYAPNDPRVAGVALLNPWVRTEAGEAAAYLRHYYWRRLFDRAFWAKVVQGRFRAGDALGGLLRNLQAVKTSSSEAATGETTLPRGSSPQRSSGDQSLPERMASSLGMFGGQVLLVLSGNDLVAAEFENLAASSGNWQCALGSGRTNRCRLAGANHTFASEEWRSEVARITLDWIAKHLAFQT